MPIQTHRFYTREHLFDTLKEREDTIETLLRDLSNIQCTLVIQGPTHQVPADKLIFDLLPNTTVEKLEERQRVIHDAIFGCQQQLIEASTRLDSILGMLHPWSTSAGE